VDDRGCRQDIGLQPLLELLPANRALTTTTAEPVAPHLLRIATNFLQPTAVPSAPRILAMPASLQAEHPVLVVPGRMTLSATPPPPRLLRTAEPLPGCPAFAPPQPPARLRPVVGQSEARAGAVPRVGRRVAVRFPKRHQRRLRRRNSPAKTGEPLWPPRPDPAGVCFHLTSDDKLIGTAGQEPSSLPAWPYFTLTPFLPRMMEEYMRYHR
jgi:hypothetical protein